ncbi:MAG: tRNA pseudouridine(38-40) synthase TruA [Bacteroidota bacterium]
MRYFVKLSYNGKNYHGWQKQPKEVSVQEVLEKAFTLLLNQKIEIVGCGRTDSGVHASEYFAHFDVENKIDVEDLIYRLNAFLPTDIVIHRFFLVKEDAHARFDAISRSYEYRIFLGKDPFLTDLTWQTHHKNINVDLMNEAVKTLFEYENFKCFSRSKTDVKTYNCTITQAKWELEDKLLIFYISANRFLRNMVRAIVGTLLDVGSEKITIEEFRKIIESKNRSNAGASVKAKGLFLTKIEYPYELESN